MDIHLGVLSVEDTRKAHMADLAVQEKYGVKYHQYWYNEAAGTVCCLMEAPDKESCAATHQEANGFTACQIVEVETGMYELFMGENHQVDHGLVRHEDGEIDNGYRYLLTLDIIAKAKRADSVDFNQLKLPKKPQERALRVIDGFGGNKVKTGDYDFLIAVFKAPENAFECACEIQKEFISYRTSNALDRYNITFNMGISVGQPLTETEGFFVKATQMSRRMCLIAGNREIIISKLFEELCDTNEDVEKHKGVRIIKLSEQKFLDKFMDITENRFSDHEFDVEHISKEIGISKPQLYRKVTAITGRSPVNFIRDIRLNKALSLIKEDRFNISEIALEVGYNNPSYFAKCFHEKFGVNPSKIV